MKKAVAVILALCMFGSVAAFAAFDDEFVLPDGRYWLCDEHHCIANGDDICPLCYQIYVPSTRAIGNTASTISSIGYRGVDSLQYMTSYTTASYDASTGSYNGTILGAYVANPYMEFQFNIPNLYYNDGSYSKPTDYPYWILQFDIESTAEFVMDEDISKLQFATLFSGSTPLSAANQKELKYSKVSDGHFEFVLAGESLRVDQILYICIMSGTWAEGDTFSISNISLKSSNDYASDTPELTPPGPMSPPTDSDQWLDEQYQGAVNPELNDKLNAANSKLEQIEEIESGVIDQLDQYYDQVSPDNIEFHSNLISSMRWIGTQFDECLGSINTYGLMGVVTLPLFVGLCLLLIGRGGQVMAATRLHVNRSRRSDDA